MVKPRGDATPIKKYKTKKGIEYLSVPYGPAQFPQAKKRKILLDSKAIWKG